MVKHFKKSLTTKEMFHDVTEDVKELVSGSGVKNGIAVIFSKHTTALVRILEKETLLMEDMANFLERYAPSTVLYKHDDIQNRVDVPSTERQNGYSHLRALFFNHSESVPIKDGKLEMGKWQSIFFVECDPFRDREYLITIMGE